MIKVKNYFSSTRRTIRGIISPLRMTSTIHPISKFKPRIYSILCKVALETVASPITTGSSIATGVTTPDYPVCHTTSSSLVTTPSCFSFKAKEPRG